MSTLEGVLTSAGGTLADIRQIRTYVLDIDTAWPQVEPVWREWLARWPTAADLAAEAPGEAVRAWGRLGYPRRALRLHQAARAVVERHGGEVPRTEEALRALPGIGAYTAAAVACSSP